jgi:septum formation protein
VEARFPAGFSLILASQSPRRHSLLRELGIPFSVVQSLAEEILEGAPAAALAESNALAKARGAVLPDWLEPGAFVLGTDTLVTIDGRVMGKPSSAEEAAAMLASLSGRTHQVVSGVALIRTGTDDASPADGVGGGHTATGCATTDVTFVELRPSQMAAYVDCGEWKGKAGGYAVQGLAGLFVSGIRGEHSNVVGLPLCLLARLFRESGFDLVAGQWL